MVNFILAKMGKPMLVIDSEARGEYLASLNAIRTEGTDEYLIMFFFKQAMLSLQNDINNKKQANSFGRKMMFVF